MANTTPQSAYQSQSRYMIGLGGVFALLFLGALCLWTLARTGVSSDFFSQAWHDSYIHHVIFITIKQALLSVLFATIIGVSGALAFYRRPHFLGRNLLLMLCFTAMILPSTVAALSLLKLWGQSGLLAQTPLAFLVPDRLGLWSVILAHMFFNVPLIMRVSLTALEAVPLAQRHNAALLGLSVWRYFLILDWPAIRAVLPAIMGLVFLLCATSFSLVLMLGGGPAVTTLEVSIYTALRFDFNLPQAAFLSFVQLLICLIILRLFQRGRHTINALNTASSLFVPRADSKLWFMRLLDSAIIGAIIFLTIVPMGLLLVQSDVISGLYLLQTERFWQALLNSTTLAIGASFMALCLAFLLGLLAHEAHLRSQAWVRQLIDISHSLFLLIPALVLGTAFFILLRPYVNVSAHAFWILMLGNGLLALPFCHRIIVPALLRHLQETDRLCALLNLSQTKRLFVIILPSLRTEIGFALGLSAALSFGDLGIITLFGSQSFETLPYMLFSFLSRYGAEEADILALILLAAAIGLYGLFTKLVALWGKLMAG